MSKLAYIIILVYFFVGLNHAGFIDSLQKCSVKDSECQKKLFQNSLKNIDKTGIPELNIPAIDPIHLKNVTVYLLDAVNLTLIDGVVKGVKNCEFKKIQIDLEKGIGDNEILCDVVIKGHFVIKAVSPVIETILGGSELHGDGKGKVKIEKLQLGFNYPIGVIKKDDGEIYLTTDFKKVVNRFDVLGKVSFAAEKIYVGDNDVSDLLVNYLNQNWRFVIQTFGKFFIAKASEFYNEFAENFFGHVPTRYYVIEDLTPYL